MSMAPEEKVIALPILRRKVLAAMETGQTGRARTIIAELSDLDIEEARKLRADVVAAYGIDVAA